MKKILTLILAFTMMMSFTVVKADENVQPANALTMPGWTIATDVPDITVERVYHNGSWMMKLTDKGGVSDIDKIKYIVPESKLTEGHTYEVTMYSDIDSSNAKNGWIYFYAGAKKFGDTWYQNHLNGRTIKVTGVDLYANNQIVFGFDATVVAEWYLDNLVIKDETTGENLDLENADFETTIECTPVNDVAYVDGTLTWTVPENMVGDAINVYKRELNGEKTLLTESPVAVEIGTLNLPIQSENSYYLDIYTCYNGTEDVNTLVSIPLFGETDFGEYKLFSGENEIDAVEAGTLTVKVPFINREIETGFGFEVIVLVKEGIKTVNIENKPFTAEITEDFVDYSVDIAVDEVTENTNIEVYVWDGIESMNVLRDVSVF